MKNTYNQEVENYLNNKFGDDFSLAEPYPYWMISQEKTMNQRKAKKELEFKCWCEVMDDLLMQIAEEADEAEMNS
ncbi:MAG: hypothetical protein J5965_19365 [Aeriscardovia sp.]|nr:hypothetical protein [Aeriscardovia sp.]